MAEQNNANQTAQTEEKKSTLPGNVVLVGKKPPMSYVLAVVTQFNNGAQEVKVRARGAAISRAVDVVEIVKHKFIQGLKVLNIAIDSEDRVNEDNTTSKVSTIEITISK
mgnify:FL=1